MFCALVCFCFLIGSFYMKKTIDESVQRPVIFKINSWLLTQCNAIFGMTQHYLPNLGIMAALRMALRMMYTMDIVETPNDIKHMGLSPKQTNTEKTRNIAEYMEDNKSAKAEHKNANGDSRIEKIDRNVEESKTVESEISPSILNHHVHSSLFSKLKLSSNEPSKVDGAKERRGQRQKMQATKTIINDGNISVKSPSVSENSDSISDQQAIEHPNSENIKSNKNKKEGDVIQESSENNNIFTKIYTSITQASVEIERQFKETLNLDERKRHRDNLSKFHLYLKHYVENSLLKKHTEMRYQQFGSIIEQQNVCLGALERLSKNNDVVIKMYQERNVTGEEYNNAFEILDQYREVEEKETQRCIEVSEEAALDKWIVCEGIRCIKKSLEDGEKEEPGVLQEDLDLMLKETPVIEPITKEGEGYRARLHYSQFILHVDVPHEIAYEDDISCMPSYLSFNAKYSKYTSYLNNMKDMIKNLKEDIYELRVESSSIHQNIECIQKYIEERSQKHTELIKQREEQEKSGRYRRLK